MGTTGIWLLALVAGVWLGLGLLAVLGARRRGQRWRSAWVSGLFFPVSWVVWYLADERAAGGRASRRRRRAAL